ncbi:Conserved hypothetical protein 2001 [uncultured Gammaproteobacteria bacterium]|jgi:uncharacterized protein (TIGR02001 family)|nr:Conserved hypothetical protein 2001 [uncultured Gammaproteobacteria bacterium]VVH66745.1 Conserved hypothetical protein 2001 [uncultured Gammaproteobacteria bacterium]
MKNKSKKLVLALCLSSIFSSVSFATEEEKQSAVSANITIANDYVWRGKTQSDDKKTIQGGLDWDAGNGFALGIWGSNIADGSEFDYYGSYAGEVGAIGYEVGYIAYRYSKDAASNLLNFDEAYVGASYGDFGLTYYKGNGKKTLEVGNYIEASYGTSIKDIDVSLTVGKYSEAVKDDSSDYKVYGISLGKSYDGLDYTLSFAKVKDSDNSAAYNTLNEKNTIFSISKSF